MGSPDSSTPPAELSVEPPLRDFTAAARKPLAIHWYRTPLPTGALKRLHARSDWLGALQALGYLACLAVPAALAVRGGMRGEWVWAIGGAFAYGLVASFLINAVHELGHNTVFRTPALNVWFCRLFAFLGWINHELFEVSHVRHHRYTLHPPDDDENPLPIKFSVRDFVRGFLFNYGNLVFSVRKMVRLARGRFEGTWELTLYPADQPELARPAIRWARTVLTGHLMVLALSIAMGWWIVPIVVSAGSFFANGLFLLCNNTQHIALPSHNSDFRLCCRTFTLNPIVRFIYWHMNYHTEHHMYAAVPCYRLGELHRLIRQDLPPTPHGIGAVWKEIASIKRREAAEPGWVYSPPLPADNAART
jgi:fatty acid desaturase